MANDYSAGSRNSRNGAFNPDHRSFAEFLMSDQAVTPVEHAANDIRRVAAGLAQSVSRTEGLASGYDVETPVLPVVVAGNPRRIAEVVNHDPAATPNEFGNRRTPRRRFLGRAAAPFGDLHSGVDFG